MRPEDTFLLSLARSVSDMDEIDWDRAVRDADAGETQQVVRGLRAIAGVVELHRQSFLRPIEPPRNEDLVATLDASTSAPAPRRRWGRLRLVEVLGHGSFGDVYRAFDAMLDREVAVKLHRTPRTGTAENSLLAEGRLLARVRHPNVVAVYGVERHDDATGLWMELIRGRGLASFVEAQGSFGAREATLVGVDLCRALAATHGAGLVHGDLKAANVMREEGGRIVLMDFGAGRALLAGGGEGRVSGTPLYMAPELFAGASISVASDVYSLGVLLHYLVTARFPVSGATLDEVREAHRQGRRRLLRDERPDLPEAFLGIVERATAARPEGRFESAGAMEAALVQSLGLPTPALASRARTGRFRSALVTGGAIVALAGTMAIWAPWRTAKSPAPPPGPAVASTLPDSASVTRPAPVVPTHAPTPPPRPDPATVRSIDRQPSEGSPPSVSAAAPPTQPVAEPRSEAPALPAAGGTPLTDAYTVEAFFYRVLGDTAHLLLPGALVSLGDRLYVEFQASIPVHLYIVNEDEQGAAFLLFPLPGQEARNPLPARERVRLPGARDGKLLYWQVTSQGAREHFLLVASPERLVQLEADLLSLDRAEVGRPLLAAPLDQTAISRLRGVGGLATGAVPQTGRGGRVSELARRLSEHPETVRGIWLRSFELENPAR